MMAGILRCALILTVCPTSPDLSDSPKTDFSLHPPRPEPMAPNKRAAGPSVKVLSPS